MFICQIQMRSDSLLNDGLTLWTGWFITEVLLWRSLLNLEASWNLCLFYLLFFFFQGCDFILWWIIFFRLFRQMIFEMWIVISEKMCYYWCLHIIHHHHVWVCLGWSYKHVRSTVYLFSPIKAFFFSFFFFCACVLGRAIGFSKADEMIFTGGGSIGDWYDTRWGASSHKERQVFLIWVGLNWIWTTS